MPGEPVPLARPQVVLVVEDNPDHALLVRLAAERTGMDLDIRTVGDGVQALAYLDGTDGFADRTSHPVPDLVLLDLSMPRLDGFGVLEHLRARGGGCPVPVVVLTSSDSPADERRALRLGARAFHTKPAELDALGDQVRGIVERWLS